MASSPVPDPQRAWLRLDHNPAKQVDFGKPLDISIVLAPDGPQPRHFDAPPAQATPYVAGAFNGSVAHGASCNCAVLTLIPHCNGTHTESAGHLTADALPVHRVIPPGPIAARLVSLPLRRASEVPDEDSDPAPRPDDLLLTRAALREAWPVESAQMSVRALVIRSRPNPRDKQSFDYSDGHAPYLTRQAMQEIVTRNVEHLVLDLPSVDRSHDEGKLTGHRLFFGLAPGATRVGDVTRPQCTVTELAFIDDTIPDGEYALLLHAPAIEGDAVPSRPVLFALQDL